MDGKIKNSLKENYVKRIANRVMNTLYIYPFFKLKGPLKGHTAKIINLHYIERAPETQVAEIIESKVNLGDKVIDVGTHFGYYTLLMAKKVGSEGKVICFEPSKETRNILRNNIKKNKYQDRTIIESKGVSNERKTLPFSVRKFSPMNTFTIEEYGNVKKIECIDLDTYCKEKDITPSFLKIDVEGVEKEVIEGMKKLIRISKPKVLLEASKETEGMEEIFDMFIKNGYKVYTWRTRVDEDSWKDLVEIKRPGEVITKHIYFEYPLF